MVQSGKIIPAETIVKMLRKIIYSGDGRKKFILSSFPDIIDQAKEFERSCASISAVIYTTSDSSSSDYPIVEIKNNNLTLFNIDALFQKEHRLKTMSRWDDQKWAELIGNQKLDWSMIVGLPLQGKTTLAQILQKHLGFRLIDWKAIEDAVKATLGTADEPFEGKVPLVKVEDAIKSVVDGDRKAGRRLHYVFDSFPLHANAHDFQIFVSEKLSSPAPDYLFDLRSGGVDSTMAMGRQKKRLEAEELTEEQQSDFKSQFAASEARVDSYFE